VASTMSTVAVDLVVEVPVMFLLICSRN